MGLLLVQGFPCFFLWSAGISSGPPGPKIEWSWYRRRFWVGFTELAVCFYTLLLPGGICEETAGRHWVKSFCACTSHLTVSALCFSLQMVSVIVIAAEWMRTAENGMKFPCPESKHLGVHVLDWTVFCPFCAQKSWQTGSVMFSVHSESQTASHGSFRIRFYVYQSQAKYLLMFTFGNLSISWLCSPVI